MRRPGVRSTSCARCACRTTTGAIRCRPGLGDFPLRHVDDFAAAVPPAWLRHGGVFLPMYQAEAMWINFSGSYPMALKIAAGKVCALTGKAWSSELVADPQSYLVVPDQPWLDGFCIGPGLVRQFVAMPLGEGYSAEEQLTGEARHGGLQIQAHPMKAEVYETLRQEPEDLVMYSPLPPEATASPMGLAPGGLMQQEVYEDEYGLEAWDLSHSSRCFVAHCEQCPVSGCDRGDAAFDPSVRRGLRPGRSALVRVLRRRPGCAVGVGQFGES